MFISGQIFMAWKIILKVFPINLLCEHVWSNLKMYQDVTKDKRILRFPSRDKILRTTYRNRGIKSQIISLAFKILFIVQIVSTYNQVFNL